LTAEQYKILSASLVDAKYPGTFDLMLFTKGDRVIWGHLIRNNLEQDQDQDVIDNLRKVDLADAPHVHNSIISFVNDIAAANNLTADMYCCG
jgi:F420-0:gamma-glutamyl ligase-like protein